MHKMWILMITHPEGLDLDPAFVGDAQVTNNQEEALKDADFVYIKKLEFI